MKRNKLWIIILFVFLILIPGPSIGKNGVEKLIYISVDNLSLKKLDESVLDSFSVGLVNIKTRTPYSDQNLYLSLNVGRKTSEEEIDKKDLNLSWMGDILEVSNPKYLSLKSGEIGSLLQDENGNSKGKILEYPLSVEKLMNHIDNNLEDSELLALELDEKLNYEEFNKLIEEFGKREEKVIILPRNVENKEILKINKHLVPILFKNNEDNGVLTSSSTKRNGIIAIEDISKEIKESLGGKTNGIGERISIVENDNPIKFVRDTYETILNQLMISSVSHGILYISIGLIILISLLNKSSLLGIELLKFSIINIGTSLLLGSIVSQERLLGFLLISIIFNTFILYILNRNENYWKYLIAATYGLIVYGTMWNPSLIFNSYMGFNNLIYGARFYGLNNGIAGVLLVTSIIVIDIIDKKNWNETFKNVLVLIVSILNMITLSTKYGVNTGGFITSIILFIGVIFNYILTIKETRKKVITLILIVCFIFSLNIYIDYKGTGRGHALQFIERIMKNGLSEISYMMGFKFKELLKLTIMPPFSLVLLSQIYIIWNNFIESSKNRLIIWISIVGFIINDTGNILTIYMLSYLILELVREKTLNEYI